MKTNEIVLSILLKGTPTNDDYLATIENVPALAELSAGLLLNREPTNRELLGIIANAPGHRRKAWEKLLARQPANNEIVEVIEGIDDLRDEAWVQLQKQSPANPELIRIINGVSALQVSAWQLLMQRGLTEAELLTIYDYQFSVERKDHAALRITVANALLDCGCQNKTLIRIIHSEKGLGDMAIEMLLQRSPSREEMRSILLGAKTTARKKICRMLMEGESSIEDLRCVAIFSDDTLGDQAAERLLDQDYDDDWEERSACEAALHRPSFASRALDRCLANIRRKAHGEGQYVCDLRNLYFELLRIEVNHTLRKSVAGEFLKVSDGSRGWSDDRKAILENHPELNESSLPVQSRSPANGRKRSSRKG